MSMNKILTMIIAALVFIAASSFCADDAALKTAGDEAAMKTPADAAALVISGIEGTVLVQVAPSTEWTNAAVGQAIKQQDVIKTGDDGQALLVFSDKSSIALKPKTEVSVDELVWTEVAKKAGLSMSAGALRAIVKKIDTPSDFKVKTPTAICGARGTVFYLVVTPSETRVFVTDGAVDFSNVDGGNSYVVVQNMAAIAAISGTVTEPRELTGAERDEALAGWSGIIAETYTEVPPENRQEPDITENSAVIPENPAQENKGQDNNPVSPI